MEKTFAERLERALNRADMTQSELADITGISKGAISSYLKGSYEPKQNNIFKLAKALHVSEAYLMGVEEKEGNDLSQVSTEVKILAREANDLSPDQIEFLRAMVREFKARKE